MQLIRYKAENTPEFGKYWSVYLPADTQPEAIPPDLAEKLGKLYPEEDIDLESDSILNDQEKSAIKAAIEADGHFLEEVSFSFGSAGAGDDDDEEVEIEL